MKRIITWVLLLAMVLSVFAGCTNEAEPTVAPTSGVVTPAEDTNLANAVAYLKTIYKDVEAGSLTPADFQRLGTVRVGTTAYEVVYTVDCDESVVKIVKGTDGMVTIDVNEESEAEVPYVLTATITGTDGTTQSLTWEHVVPVSMSGRSLEIVDAAYALADGEALSYEATLTGVITSIDTPYSADYKNITVTIQIEGREDKPIQCYRLKGEGAEALAVGDTITVTGTLKNYKGTIEFDAGGNLDEVTKGDGPTVEAPTDPAEIVKAAFELEPGESLPYTVTLTGPILSYNTRYSEQYQNVTVTIVVEGRRIMCFRLKGEGADEIYNNDIITVTGVIKNYNGTIEFDAGCTLDSWEDKPSPVAPEDPKEIVDEIYELNSVHNAGLAYGCELTGVITDVNTPWSEQYQNITVTMVIAGREDKPIQCYRLSGEGAENLAVGDTISVYGWLTNYRGTAEFKQGCELRKVVKAPTQADIVDKAYALEVGESFSGTLTGVISEINTAYSEQYKNISVTIKVAGREDKPILCYRLKGDGAADLVVGDTITVGGTLTNYNGTIEFTSGCELTGVVKAEKPEAPADPKEIVDAAYELEVGASLPYTATLTGTITSIDTPYSEQYKNITVTIAVAGREDKPIQCFRLKGDSAATLAVGQTITVTGTIKNYSGTIEFISGCTLVEEKPAPSTPAEIMNAAYALEAGKSLEGSYTLTGVITSVDTAYSEQYKNVTVTISVNGSDKTIQCFRLKGDGADTIAVGNTITVTGNITNYKGAVQFNSGCTLDSVS